MYYVVSTELYHHGIKGQRWGVRRYRNYDGSLTSAGKRHYNVDVSGAEQRVKEASQKIDRASKVYNQNPDIKNLDKLTSASKDYRVSKKALDFEKTKEKLNAEDKISKHRLKIEAKYREDGMSEEEAAVAAYKRVQTEKIIAGLAGATVVATAAYVAYRHYDRNVDKIIPKDTLFSRITTNGDKGVHDAFYASFKGSDKNKYLGLYSRQLASNGASEIYQKTIGLKENLNVASEKTARKTMAEVLSKDSQAVKELRTNINAALRTGQVFVNQTPKQRMALLSAKKALDKGNINSKAVYDIFNWSLPDRGHGSDSFYNSLRKKGYDAIMDINDKRLSGYKSKAPVIIINSGKATVDKVRSMSANEIATRYYGEVSKMNVKNLLKTSALTLAVGGTVSSGSKALERRSDNKYVSAYRKEHPNSKLSYAEILRTKGE